MIVRWTQDAHANLENILARAFERDPLEACNIAKHIEAVEQNILVFPKAAHYDSAHDFYERYVPRTRVILIYRITPEAITIYRAFHTSQNPKNKQRAG